MDFTAKNINRFLVIKLPSAFICGVRATFIDGHSCITTVTHRWINQNPFNSIYFAVQSMAAELSTGALVMKHIRDSNKQLSMLVANNKCSFLKKATGRITFTCLDGDKIKAAIQEAIITSEGQKCWTKSVGTNENNEIVSVMEFEWTFKTK